MNEPHDFRILAMDGGDGRFTAQLLLEISNRLRRRYPLTGGRFLDKVTLFAGSSAGGMNSLFLANEADADAFLQSSLLQLWGRLDLAMLPLPTLPARISAPSPHDAVQTFGPLGAFVFPNQVLQYLVQVGYALVGLHSFINNDGLKAILQQHFEGRKLRDLRKTVAVVSFQLDNENPDPAKRKWTPRVFTNIPEIFKPVDNDLDEPCVDVALRTGAQPVYTPIYQSSDGTGPGFIDGGYVANSPGMVAIGRALAFIKRRSSQSPNPVGPGQLMAEDVRSVVAGAQPQSPQPAGDSGGKLSMLALGAGTKNVFPGSSYVGPERLKFFNGSATWGYLLWLLNPTQPFLLINVLLNAQTEEIDFQLDALLNVQGGSKSYLRFSPAAANSKEVPTDELQAYVRSTVSTDELDEVVDWLVANGWASGPDGSAPNRMRPAPATHRRKTDGGSARGATWRRA